MSVIVNPRGTNGAGKTELVRRLLRGLVLEPIFRPGRHLPIAYRATTADGTNPFIVIGHYERTCGGCDTVPLRDGGLDEIVRLADLHASTGTPVLLEGALLSEETTRTTELATRHDLHVLHLSTPIDLCVRRLLTRRRTARTSAARLTAVVTARAATITAACTRLAAAGATIHLLPPEAALLQARGLLESRGPGSQSAAGSRGVVRRTPAHQATGSALKPPPPKA